MEIFKLEYTALYCPFVSNKKIVAEKVQELPIDKSILFEPEIIVKNPEFSLKESVNDNQENIQIDENIAIKNAVNLLKISFNKATL